MATFAPTGPSLIVQLMGNLPQRIELPATEGDLPAIRLAATTHPSSTAYTYVALGDQSIEASNQNSMAVDMSGRKEQIIPLLNGPSHLSLGMGGITSGNYTVCVTPGTMIG